LDEKIAEAIDGMTEKSANLRTNSLNTLVGLLSQQFRPDLLLGRRETLRDNLERIFKRGQASEQGLAAQVYALTAIQLGALDPDMASEDFNAVKPCLQSLLLDHTASITVRAKVKKISWNLKQFCLILYADVDFLNTYFSVVKPSVSEDS